MIALNTQDPSPAQPDPDAANVIQLLAGLEKSLADASISVDLIRSTAQVLEESGKVDSDAKKTLVSAANLMKNWGAPLYQVQRSIAQIREPLGDIGCSGHNIDDKRVRDVCRRHLRTRKHDVIMAKPSGLSTRRKLYEFSRALRK